MSIKVLIVDDSALVRQTLERELSKDPEIEIIGSAPDPFQARDKILALKPDVITLDIEMPRMDGLSFLRKLMHYQPIPVIILSSLAKEGSPIALDALSLGALEVLCKPGAAYSIGDMAQQLRSSIHAAARVDMQQVLSRSKQRPPVTKAPAALAATTEQFAVIGASTGGVQALDTILRSLPAASPGIVVVQHMPAGFTKSFAERLNGICDIEVREAVNGDRILPGVALIAPGNLHTLVKRSGAQYHVEVKDGPLVNRHRPSVDVLFKSAAHYAASNCIGVILTGMGDDGAQGLLKLREAGAHTIGQDEQSCVVYGMPRAAVEAGAVKEVLSLDRIAHAILGRLNTVHCSAPS